MNPQIQFRKSIALSLIVLLLACFALPQRAGAISPPPDGGYPLGNTAEGRDALLSLTSGTFNTAVGLRSLRSNTEGKLNTAIGAGTLVFNTADNNTAIGEEALFSNTEGIDNTANGLGALFSNTKGSFNTATGVFALYRNIEGSFNTANGTVALNNNTTGDSNTAIGYRALRDNSTGDNNTAIGQSAGSNQTTGSGNVYIGVGVFGVAGESNACYIASIFNQTSANGIPVLINSNHKLGTMTSSARFKDEIKPMDQASEAVFALKPVTFRYKRELDPKGMLQFGLVAEDVAKVNPDLIVRDSEGKPYTVRYEAVNAMLLNEFLKEHKKVEGQQATIAELTSTLVQQQKDFQAASAQQEMEIQALAARVKEQGVQIQKVSAQIELKKPAVQTVLNNQ